uniref:CDC20/Fizzy WD40 domain-containing protein n=1 Tax=Amphora coffeiformis TaxID=265554 RepID=A0A7S3KXQ9_9STRA
MATNDVLNMSIDEDQFFSHEYSHFSPADRRTSKQAMTPATEYSPSMSSRFGEDDMSTTQTPTARDRPANDSFDSTPGETKIWVPLPSPSRPVLDPRYAARLAPVASSPRYGTASPYSSDVSPRQATDSELMPPPGINRTNLFRPAPILTNFEEQYDDRINPASSGRSQVSSQSPSRSFFSHERSDVGVSDRYIASRTSSNQAGIDLWGNSLRAQRGQRAPPPNANADTGENNANSTATTASQSQQNLLSTLLRSELLGENQNPVPSRISQVQASHPTDDTSNQLRFRSPRQTQSDNVFEDLTGTSDVFNSFSLTPIRSPASQRLMAAPPKRKRRISKVPFKVLDAPALQDDFYLNLVDWSSQNVLAVGLGSCVYLWSACTSKVTKLCDLEVSRDHVSSVAWAQRGTHLAVGTTLGEVQLWDTIQGKKVRTMPGHNARVGALAWTGTVLSSGSRDRLIYLRDLRQAEPYTCKLTNHKQEVCGLKWSFDEPAFLASGGNDNNLHVIDSRNPETPVHKFAEHTAAVKAITWSPHQHGLLASGGGTADRCIRFWNTLSGVSLNKIDTGSQVCNMAWSQNCNEIVSTHGYSLNQIVVWRYPSMSKVATLTGHTYRVLYLALSPDGSTAVTGAGDETLRFWQIFPGPRSGEKDGSGGLLFPNTLGSVIR